MCMYVCMSTLKWFNVPFIVYYLIDVYIYIGIHIYTYCNLYFKMTDINEENAFPFEKTLLNTIVKNTKETKVIKLIIII